MVCSANVLARNTPDSVYIFSYATLKNAGHNGLHFAWSIDRKNWSAIGPEYRYLFCDYGRWGSEKRMVNPFLIQTADGFWHCIWSVNEKDSVFAHAASRDLVNWQRQSYPAALQGRNCLKLEASYDKKSGEYLISWLSTKGEGFEIYSMTTKDFKTYTAAKPVAESVRLNMRDNIIISNNSETGIVRKVPWSLVDELLKTCQISAYNGLLYGETYKTDSSRFALLKKTDATVTVDVAQSKKISDLLIGVFFEDINYAADGGLYAELVQNRDFEYVAGDKEGRDTTWNAYKAWSLSGKEGTFTIDTIVPLNTNNKHYAVLNIETAGVGFVNEGFDNMAITNGDKYDFSLFARNTDKKGERLKICFIGKDGENYGETMISTSSDKWKRYEATLIATTTVSNARLEIVPQDKGRIDLDMVSLFPQKTFMGHKNGLRADLAQSIANLHPRFVRFPGGCVAHGDGLGNIYRWKNTVGPLEARKPQRNIWGYHQTAGLGYFEYFQFCEDIGAEPLPVIAAGVPCQNSATGGAGQQGGLPMCDMGSYVQDILDLVEWANGDVKTKWGKVRAEAGHPKPFNLTYVGIGNEDLITDIFEERFTMIFNALKEKHPEITVVGTVGPNSQGTDYDEGWDIATKLRIPMVDEHYYQSPGWFIHNQDFYDRYDRSKSKVYLGEYASWGNSLYNALTEALYLSSIERNGDVVSMASYAPLLAKEGHTQWNPDLIYFNNTTVKPTVNYYVQQLYGQNSGDSYLYTNVKLSDNSENLTKRVAASAVHDSKTGDLIIKLVNLLPIEINTKVKMNGAGDVNPSASLTLLTGAPSNKKVEPVTSALLVSDNFNCSLPAYSFTLIRIKNLK